MNNTMNGKAIKQIWLFDAIGVKDDEVGFSITAHGNRTLELSSTYHGDRDEIWVVVKKGCDEEERHNCKNVACIVWA